MVTVVDFVVELVRSTIELLRIFVFEVALADPLSFVSFLAGAAVIGVTMGAGGYLALGALADALGVDLSA